MVFLILVHCELAPQLMPCDALSWGVDFDASSESEGIPGMCAEEFMLSVLVRDATPTLRHPRELISDLLLYIEEEDFFIVVVVRMLATVAFVCYGCFCLRCFLPSLSGASLAVHCEQALQLMPCCDALSQGVGFIDVCKGAGHV